MSLAAIGNFVAGFFYVNWTSEAIHDLEDTILNGPVGTYCASVGTGVSATVRLTPVIIQLTMEHEWAI